jgi:hypothetical protein
LFCFRKLRVHRNAVIVSAYKMPRRHGMGGYMLDADIWGVAWVVFAAVAGFGLAVAAITLRRRANDDYDFAAGYNALATVVDR